MKKKILSLMLAMVMMLSLSVTALAATGVSTTDDGGSYTIYNEDGETVIGTYTDVSSISITKNFSLVGDGTLPTSEEFSFSVNKEGVTNAGVGSNGDTITKETMPNLKDADSADLDTFTITTELKEGSTTEAAGTYTIYLPNYDNVGVYTYTISETEGTTAGIDYDDQTILLTVTVVRNDDGDLVRLISARIENSTGNKVDGSNGGDGTGIVFNNTYSAGSLEITKNVTGSYGDTSAYFVVYVTLTGDSTSTYKTDGYKVTGGSYTQNPSVIEIGETTTFYLKDDDTIIIEDLPYGVTYTVTEKDYTTSDGYDEAEIEAVDSDSENGTTGEIDSAKESVTITNNKGGDIDTGISLDSLPYILMLIVVAAGVVIMISRRRLDNRF